MESTEEKKETVTSEPVGTPKETDPDKATEEAEAKAKADALAEEAKLKEAEKKEPEKADSTKPPPGFVPHEALQQERHKVKSLKAEIQKLQAEHEKLKAPKTEPEEFKDFKVRTTEEYKQLLEADSDAASLYLYNYNRYLEHQNSIQRQQTAEKQASDAEKSLVIEGATEIEKIVPGFYRDKDPETDSLAKFAVSNGFEPGLLYDMSNPATKIIAANGDKYVLGAGAAQLVKMIKNTFAAIGKIPNESDIRKSIEAELRPKIESEVQAMAIAKLKGQDAFHSLDSATSSSEKKIKSSTGAISEKDYANLSQAEQAALLGGV